MIRLYQFPLSGNCHKVRLLLGMLGLPHERIDVAGARGEHKAPAFLALNPLGQVPVLVDGDVVVRDSQAILFYLAQTYGLASGQPHWWPLAPALAADVVAWLSVAANEVSRGPGLLRLHHKFGRAIDVAAAEATSATLLGVLDAHLSRREWLVGAQVSIADLAVYPYIALAPEGRVDLQPHAGVVKWLRRLEALPAYEGMAGMQTAGESA